MNNIKFLVKQKIILIQNFGFKKTNTNNARDISKFISVIIEEAFY